MDSSYSEEIAKDSGVASGACGASSASGACGAVSAGGASGACGATGGAGGTGGAVIGADVSPSRRLPARPLPAHGGDVEGYRARFGKEPIDASANVNPLGMSPAARIAARAAVDDASRYPDPFCRELAAAIAAHEGVDPSWVLCGNGAADLIWRLALALKPRRALLCAPTFSEYAAALRAVGCEVARHRLLERDGFALTDRFLGDIAPAVDLIFLCVPNNPTGLVPPRSLLRAVLDACERAGAVLVVDECFNGFLPDPAAASVVDELGSHPHAVVLSAFTKLYGMAGLRLGYLLSADSRLVEAVRAAGQAWPVSRVAQEAGVAALADDAYVRESRDLVAVERRCLAEGLAYAGLTVFPSQANYLFARAPIPDFARRMEEHGVMVRDCSTYEGLRPGYVRIAVRTPAENRAIVRAAREVVADARDEAASRNRPASVGDASNADNAANASNEGSAEKTADAAHSANAGSRS